MRLNFSGSDEDEIREGVRRIGAVVAEQVELFQTITGEHRPAAPPDETEGGDVVPFRR
jgi:2-aminoadipate transaminase